MLTAHDTDDRAFRRLQRRDRRLHHGARDRRAGGRVRGRCRKERVASTTRAAIAAGRATCPIVRLDTARIRGARLALRALHARGAAPLDAGDDPGHESGEDVSVVSPRPVRPTSVRSRRSSSCSPDNDVAEPELSIVIPALNEELTIADFVAWCHEGMKKAGVRRRDPDRRQRQRSHDRAGAGGRRARAAARRSAASAAPTSTRSRTSAASTSLMGDSDCTYDFRELGPFVEKFRGGAEFVMGSRFRGYIEPGSMPPLAPLPRHAGHDLDPERHLRKSLLRHPLRHARHHQGGARAHGPALAVLGVRLGDGPQVGAHEAAHRARCRSASSRIATGG